MLNVLHDETLRKNDSALAAPQSHSVLIVSPWEEESILGRVPLKTAKTT